MAIQAAPSTFDDVLAARERLSRYLSPTPLYRYPALSEFVGAEVWVKHENHQPVGAFKVRGGINLVSQLSVGERERGWSPPRPGTMASPWHMPPGSSVC